MRDIPLTIALADGVLTISVGVETLALAAESAPKAWPYLRVLDVDAFAADVVRALETEQEDGTTAVHELFDDATIADVNHADPPGDRLRAAAAK